MKTETNEVKPKKRTPKVKPAKPQVVEAQAKVEAQMSPELWAETAAKGTSVTTEMLDRMGKEYQEAYAKYEEAKAASTKLYNAAEELEGKLVEALELAGKSKYYVEGVGTFYFIDKLTVPTPKTIDDKKKLFQYMRTTHGDTFFFDKTSVNHQTLQKLYNTDFEEFIKKCEAEGKADQAANFSIPGLQSPTNMRSLGLKKEKE